MYGDLGSWKYSYNSRNELTRTIFSGKNSFPQFNEENFVWDGAGNNIYGISNPDGPSEERIRPLIFNNQVLEDNLADAGNQPGRYNFLYDRNGNIRQKYEREKGDRTEMKYDSENKLRWIRTRKDGKYRTVSFKYDGLGRRVEKEVEVTGDPITRYNYVYDVDNALLEKKENSSGTRESLLVTDRTVDNQLMAVITDASGAKVDKYYHRDHLGSLVGVSNSTSEIESTLRYSSFGLPLLESASVFSELPEATGYFTGREFDSALDLYFYRARYYDPEMGRFISEDPLGLRGGDANLYRYVGNNSVGFKDPFGLRITGRIHTPSEFKDLLRTPGGRAAIESRFIGADIRFVYTESGVIDMRHAQAGFESTRSLIELGIPTEIAEGVVSMAGIGVEVPQLGSGIYGSGENLLSQEQTSFGLESAFSSEDLPSNSFGISGARDNLNFIDFVNSIEENNSCLAN